MIQKSGGDHDPTVTIIISSRDGGRCVKFMFGSNHYHQQRLDAFRLTSFPYHDSQVSGKFPQGPPDTRSPGHASAQRRRPSHLGLVFDDFMIVQPYIVYIYIYQLIY